MSATVSVALCTHNGSRYLRAQLDSILRQSMSVTEIVLSDDASTDGTVALAREVVEEPAHLAGASPELTVFENPRALGVTRNFEQAIRACRGDLIVLCDQDDVWFADRVAVMVEEFERRPELTLLHTDARLVDGHGLPLGHTLFDALRVQSATRARVHAGDAFSVLLRRNVVTGATVMFRASLLERAMPFSESWVHDEWLALVAATIGTLDLLDRATVDYRQHGRNEIGVAKPSARANWGRLTQPGKARNERLLGRARDFTSWCEKADDVSAGKRESAREKLAHEIVRSGLPTNRLARVAPVLAERRTGRYLRFGNGDRDVLRDLVQPLG